MDSKTRYRELIADRLESSGADTIFLYWKGRVALYALLKAMKVGEGDEVILPGFTCVVVPNAIKYTGARPVYVDVDQATMNAPLQNFRKAVTPETRAIIVQNTFGLSTQVDEIATFARKHNIFTIEDCTHGFGGFFKGKPNGSYCDAAFFSTQWNKPFSTGIGGFARVNNPSVDANLISVNQGLLEPSAQEIAVLKALMFARERLLRPANYWALRSLYRLLSKYKIVVGSSENKELSGAAMPAGFFKDISQFQAKMGIRNLMQLNGIMERRYTNALIYNKFLIENGKTHIPEEVYPDHCFLKFPVLVKERPQFEQAARKAKIELGDWFCSPLYPVHKNWERWDLDVSAVPNAHYLSEHVVNFPTETRYPEKVIKFAEQHLNDII